MTQQQPVSLDFMILAGLGRVVMWLAFAVFHLALAVIGLFLLWWWQIPPERIARYIVAVPVAPSVQWIALAGGSGVTILALDCWCWRRIYTRLTTPYIFRAAERAAGLSR